MTPRAADVNLGRHVVATAWKAVTASEPDALLGFVGDRKRSLPFLLRGLTALLYHLDSRNGRVWFQTGETLGLKPI
jgi:hypothetical protein